MPVENRLHGLNYEIPSDQAKAQRADLITLPANIPGTNCGNCMFFNPANGFCRHGSVQLTVNERMCCKFWKNQRQLNSWE